MFGFLFVFVCLIVCMFVAVVCLFVNLFAFASIILVSEHPGDPMLSNCPPFVTEGNDVNCSCQASGNPPAVVTWYGNGVTDNVLVLRNVSRSLDGQNYTCNQFWGGVNSNWRTTTYSVQVHCESPDVCNPPDKHAGSVITSVKKKEKKNKQTNKQKTPLTVR